MTNLVINLLNKFFYAHHPKITSLYHIFMKNSRQCLPHFLEIYEMRYFRQTYEIYFISLPALFLCYFFSSLPFVSLPFHSLLAVIFLLFYCLPSLISFTVYCYFFAISFLPRLISFAVCCICWNWIM